MWLGGRRVVWGRRVGGGGGGGRGVHHMAQASPRDRLSLGDRGREWTSGNDVLTSEGG